MEMRGVVLQLVSQAVVQKVLLEVKETTEVVFESY